jgi:phosphoglycerate dehydrogenase-like enzyme
MKSNTLLAVTSRSFSSHPVLRSELLERYPNVRFNDDGSSLSGDNLIEFCRGCEKIITALEKIDDYFLSALPELQVISKYGVGTDMLDIDAMINHGVRLGWTGGVNRRSVSELVIAFSIALLRNFGSAFEEVPKGVWQNRIGGLISGRTFGIIGCGHIGKDLARILRAFECQILANDILDFPEFYAENQVRPVELEELLRTADIVTLHVPLDESTRNLLSSDRLALMKPESFLINAARGGIVDEQALKTMLQDDRLAGAAFDVFSSEPPTNLELLRLPNFLATPHIGGSSEEAILAMGRAAINGLDENELPSATHPS